MKNNITYALIIIAAALFVVAAISGVLYVRGRMLSATAPLEITSPEPGVRCASLVTAHGAALSCWELRK